MYWLQTAYNMNNIMTPKEILENCHKKGIEQIIIGDEGPYSWIEFEDENNASEKKIQLIFAIYKEKGNADILWMLRGDALKATSLLEVMYQTNQYYNVDDLIPVYIPKNDVGNVVHGKTIKWMEKISDEYYVMENQSNEKAFKDCQVLKKNNVYIHRVRSLEVNDTEITEVRRKINGEKDIVRDYNYFLKPEHFLRDKKIHETKKQFKKMIGFLNMTTPRNEVTKKMEYWNKEQIQRMKLVEDWSKFFTEKVVKPEEEWEVKKILLLCRLAGEGFNKKYKKSNTDALERLKNELTVVVKLGFYEYFLMVQDFTQYAHNNQIKIGQRGSVIGSILAYCLNITDVDPIEYGLKFERFLNKNRTDKPDIDIDVQTSKLKKMIDYIKEKYGEGNVAKIITFSSFGLRIAINNVRRIDGIKVKIEELLPKIDMPLNKFLETEAFENYMIKMTSDGYRSIIERAIRIAELPQSISIHTAGVVISEEVNGIPLMLKDGERVIPFSKNGKQIERLGFIKFDFLSSSVLDIVMNTQEVVGHEINIPLDDQASFEMIGSPNSYGLFQIKSQGIKEIARKIKPKNLNDVMDILALGRPGPKDEINAYIKNREQKNYALNDLQGKILEETRILSDKLERTNGILIYQEQIMEVSEEWAGFSKEESDSFRVAVSSKDKKIMQEQKSNFIRKSKEKNRDEQTTIEVFKIIEKFASYGFGKSHAAGYAIRTYETAYLKKHFTQEFMIALANASLDKSEKIAEVLKEMRRLKLTIDKPNLQNVSTLFQKNGNKILYSLVAIKGIGFKDALKIEDLNLKKIKNAKEFLEIQGIDKRVKEILIKSGIVDNLGDRWMLLSSLRRDKQEYQEIKNEKERKVIYKKWENELIRL